MTILETLQPWLAQYGCFALFVLLAVGIFGLPIPDETIMVLCGYLIAKGSLNLWETVIACLAGSVCGITLSYGLGRLAGSIIAKKIGPWIGLTDARVAKVQHWFATIGKWTLTVGYFVPGVRHFTGYVAGAAQLSYKQFVLFAYSGAAVWVATFLSLGYFFGETAEQFIQTIDTDVLIGLGIVVLLGAIGSYIRYKRSG